MRSQLQFVVDQRLVGFPSYSICATSKEEYDTLVGFMKTHAAIQDELPDWNETDRPSVVYATDQQLVFWGSQIRDTLKGSRKVIGPARFFSLLKSSVYAKVENAE